MASVEQTSARIADAIKGALADCLPQAAGYDVKVTLFENYRVMEGDASSDSWDPAAHGVIHISFAGPAETGDTPVAEPGAWGRQARGLPAALGFRPVKIKGEPLSETILRDRGALDYPLP